MYFLYVFGTSFTREPAQPITATNLSNITQMTCVKLHSLACRRFDVSCAIGVRSLFGKFFPPKRNCHNQY